VKLDQDMFLRPDWPAPAGIRAVATTRLGGVSTPPFASLNLGAHVGDSEVAVLRNREILQQQLGLPGVPRWLNQVHGNRVIDAADVENNPRADGSFARTRGTVCVVMTADCLPILLCDQSGRAVAALHGGWRGLAAGIVESGIRALGGPSTETMAWLGPAIGPEAFEVGTDVRNAFVEIDRRHADAFVPTGDRWLADIYQLARTQLEALGVSAIYGGNWCTYTDSERFYSYRREGTTGRMASLIWIEQQ
jgi:YfiH family protein